MKIRPLALIPAALVVISSGASQGAVIYNSLSNDRTSSGIIGIGPTGTSVSFVVPDDSEYLLTSLVFHVWAVPLTATFDIYVTISASSPAGSLDLVGQPVGSLRANGAADGMVTALSGSGISLAAGETYWVTLRQYATSSFLYWVAEPASTGSAAPDVGATAGGGHVVGPPRGGTESTWVYYDSVPAMQINATAVPEPGAALLAGIAGFGLLRRRR